MLVGSMYEGMGGAIKYWDKIGGQCVTPGRRYVGRLYSDFCPGTARKVECRRGNGEETGRSFPTLVVQPIIISLHCMSWRGD